LCACKPSRQVIIPGGDWRTPPDVVVSHARHGAYMLVVNVDGKQEFMKHAVRHPPWMHACVDLTPCRGRTITLEVNNQPASLAEL
jgi:hypothetical protein